MKKPNKVIRCFKNGTNCDYEIIKINEDICKNENKKEQNIYCFKIKGKNGIRINDIFKNLILEQK